MEIESIIVKINWKELVRIFSKMEDYGLVNWEIKIGLFFRILKFIILGNGKY